MQFKVERENDAGQMDTWEFPTYQAALDFLAELYGLPSSAWGPQLTPIIETLTLLSRIVTGRCYPDGRDLNDDRKTYLITIW